MKKYLLTIFLSLFFVLFNSETATAQSAGTCIIKQQENSYSIDTPFYWYEVSQTTTIYGSMSISTTHNHTYTYINNR